MVSPSVALRIGGGFAILVTGSIGVVLPLFLQGANDSAASPPLLLLKSFAAGVVLALALVHLLNDAYKDLAQLPEGTLHNDFPICGVFVCVGIFVMFLSERISLDLMSAGEDDPKVESTRGDAATDVEAVAVHERPPSFSVHAHEHLTALTAAREIVGSSRAEQMQRHTALAAGIPPPPRASVSGSAAASAPSPEEAFSQIHGSPQKQGHGHSHSHGAGHTDPHGHRVETAMPAEIHAPPSPRRPAHPAGPPPSPSKPGNHHGGHGHGHGHVHALPVLSGNGDALTEGLSGPEARRRVLIAHLLEFSIVVHSMVIGLNLGTNSGHSHHVGADLEEEEHHAATGPAMAPEAAVAEPKSLRPIAALIIVLCFHQLFEGIALGSYIAELREAATLRSKFLMSAIFALTVPVGTWIGIGIASSYDSESVTALWVTGSLNAMTGGMLLYNALITFLAEESSRDDLGSGAAGRRLKMKMYLMTLFGAACMALLGIWA